MSSRIESEASADRFSGPKATRTKQLLLDTAKRLFLERGYDATAVEHIAEAAGVSRATFYTYFASKRDVVVGVSLMASDAMLAAIRRFGELPADWTLDHIDTWVRAYFAYQDDYGAWALAWDQASRGDDDLRPTRGATMRFHAATLGRELQRVSGRTDRDPVLDGLVVLVLLQRLWLVGQDGEVTGDKDSLIAAATEAVAALVR
jgi:AcrR family transcriptional regulator